ncbi:hypothetical protein BUALT_Bualt15G0075600 [Buddleja alternifolia]|uniref:Uncharacterized protein n=1 Tax=Buddleja alternifolia TaxID=168488 RepID=A0AAV6WP95_9LAMI|nr:hypothetical protein BUALT_Bualt15G0075600 [Buddleja alternifolia]
MKHATRVMVLARSGTIISTASLASGIGVDDEGLEQFMNSMANLKGVTLKADDVANAALFLASDEARYARRKVAMITGGASGIGECTANYSPNMEPKLSLLIFKIKLATRNCDPPRPRLIDNEKNDFEHVLSINVTGVFLGMKHAARVMVPARSGSMISTTSIASGIGGSSTHAYTASKHAVVGLVKNLAVELGQFGIRVNCLSPHLLATPLAAKVCGTDDEGIEQLLNSMAILKGTTLKAHDIANAALFLASDEAGYVSGQLFIDGGFGIVNSALKYPESLA